MSKNILKVFCLPDLGFSLIRWDVLEGEIVLRVNRRILFIGISFYRQHDERYKWFIKPCVLLAVFDIMSYMSHYWLFNNYIFSFFFLGFWWIFHHYLFHYIKRTDGVMIWINILFLMTVSLIPFGNSLLSYYSTEQIIAILYPSIGATSFLLFYIIKASAALAEAILIPKVGQKGNLLFRFESDLFLLFVQNPCLPV